MMNGAAQKIFGMKLQDVLGKTFEEVHPPMFRRELSLVMRQLTRSKPGTGVFWEQNISLPGRKTIRINVRPVFLRNGTFAGLATVMQDITEMVELDEAKTAFLSTVAHELRTPLTALKGSLGLILGGAVGDIDPGLRELMDIAQNNCNRLIRLVDDMLDVAKIESGHLGMEMDIVSVQERVMDAVRQMRHLAQERQVKLVAKVEGKPQPVVGDGDRIEQVVTNLLSNAIKFSPEDTPVEVVVSESRGYVRVSVTDCGPGIPAAEQMKVFDKFYQVNGGDRPRERGSGLGLAISKGIVEQHGGIITLESAEGEGCRFTFALPIPGEDALPSDEPDE
jgi:PAS domain S-box-containing protein